MRSVRLTKEQALRAIAREARALPERFSGCALCGLVHGHPRDTMPLAESRHAVALLSRYALRQGHVLVVLRRHIERWSDLAWPAYRDMQKLAWEASRALESTLQPVRVFVAALGSRTPLPMTFPHHHLHVVPIFEGDASDRPAKVFTWSSGVTRATGASARVLRDSLKDAWP